MGNQATVAGRVHRLSTSTNTSKQIRETIPEAAKISRNTRSKSTSKAHQVVQILISREDKLMSRVTTLKIHRTPKYTLRALEEVAPSQDILPKTSGLPKVETP